MCEPVRWPMVVIKISDEYTISIPIPYRQMLPAGQEVAVIADPRGRLIIMPMKLIDTDIVIDHFHGHRAALEYFAETLAGGEALAISVVTLAELTGGMRP